MAEETKDEGKRRESSSRRSVEGDKRRSGHSSSRSRTMGGPSSHSRSSRSSGGGRSSRDEEDREAKRRASRPSRSSNKSREELDREAKQRARRQRSNDSGDAANNKSDSNKSRAELDREAKQRARRRRSNDSGDALNNKSDSKAKHRVRPSSKASAPGVVQEYNSDRGDRRRRTKEKESRGASRTTMAGAVSSTSSRHAKEAIMGNSNNNSNGGQSTEPQINIENQEPEHSLLKEDGGAPTLAGSLVGEEQPIVATAVDDSPAASMMPPMMQQNVNNGINENVEQSSSETPKKPFYCKGYFWIAIIFILAGAGVAIFFLTQPKTESNEVQAPAPVEQAAPEKPTNAPTLLASTSPSTSSMDVPLYPPPSEDDCAAVSKGQDLDGQDDLTVFSFLIPLDVVLSTPVDQKIVEDELREKFQSLLVPELIGCPSSRRRQMERGSRVLVSSPYSVANGKVDVQAEPDTACTKSNEENCLHVVVNLDAYVRGSERLFDLISLISQALGQDIKNKLGLAQPFSQVFIVTVTSRTTTVAPSPIPTAQDSNSPTLVPTSTPSMDPTTAPVTYPTTEEPTGLPTVAPAVAATSDPTLVPSLDPTFAPVTDPTPPPSFAPVTDPTPLPTPFPTLFPTLGPSSSPSALGSSSPSSMPTDMPTSGPTLAPTRSPTSEPTSAPTDEPSKNPTPAPTSNPSFGGTFGSLYTSSTYVMYHTDYDNGLVGYDFNTREGATEACDALGLDLCSKEAITGADICAAGWLTDAVGYYISNPRAGCKLGTPGFVDWYSEYAGAFCCGRPLYMPKDNAVTNLYIYDSIEEARAGCATEGLGLCKPNQIIGYGKCAFGWLDDGSRGLYNDGAFPEGCGNLGLNQDYSGEAAGAFCCATYD